MDIRRWLKSRQFGALSDKGQERGAQVLEAWVGQLVDKFVAEAVKFADRLPEPVVTWFGPERGCNRELLGKGKPRVGYPTSLGEALRMEPLKEFLDEQVAFQNEQLVVLPNR